LATTVYDVVDIELSDGTSITLKPLPIKQHRKFMEIINSMQESEDQSEEAAMDVFIRASMECLKVSRPDLGTNRENFEEVIEIPTMMKILEVSGGLKLTDPNLLGAALVGTN
jgi:hypothetical protein